MAGSTGLEPAASGVTGRRSNQLNYDPNSNAECGLRIADYPIEIRIPNSEIRNLRVGGTGFEPVTAGV